MIPRTYPSTDASNGQSQLIGYYLSSVVGLTRWVDYIPVRFNSYLNGPENTYDRNGYMPISAISSVTGLTPFKDYVPLYIDNTSTDVWTSNVAGYIPIGLKKSVGASLELDFTKTDTLDSRITFTRASTATVTDSSGTIVSSAINTPRFEYDGGTRAPKGLLIEEQRTNLFTYSDQFDNVAWTKVRATISANAVASPDGTVNADKLIEDTSAGSHTVKNTTSITITSGTTLTSTVYAKAAEGAYVIVGIGDGGGVNISRATFNLSTQAITFITTAAANVSAPTPLITPVGNGWFRCSVTATVNVTTAQAWYFKASNLGGSSYTGDGTSGIYIWGAQLEAGAFPTSYIPTVASQVTRSVDVAVMTGTNFSSWYNATEGTFFAQFTPLIANYGNNKNIFLVSDNTTSNYSGLRMTSSGSVSALSVAVGGITQANASTGTMVAGTTYKLAGAYAVNNFAAIRDSGIISTDTLGTIPVVSRAEIGCLTGVSIGSQYINKLAYYPTRLSDTELRAITA